MSNNTKRVIRKIEELVLSKDSSEILTLDSLCEHLNLSRSQIHRIVKQETGFSTTIFIRKLRIEVAKNLLLETNLNISEICYQVGIENPQSFSQYFRQFEGVSPTQFREQKHQPDHTDTIEPESIQKKKVFNPHHFIIGFIAIIILLSATWFIYNNSSDTIPEALAQKPLAVLRFENQTGEEANDVIGYMAMDWISSGLLNVDNAKVMKVENAALEEANKTYFRDRGAAVFIKGRYYIENGDQLLFTCDIVNAETGQIIYSLPTIQGNKNKPIPALESIQQQIVGYYKLEDSYNGRYVPRFDAYIAYVDAIATPFEYPFIDNVRQLKNAIALDSLFIDPYYSLFSLGHWKQIKGLSKNAIAYLEAHEDRMSEYQLLRFNALKAVDNGDHIGSASYYWQLYKKYGDIMNGEATSVQYRFANYLQACINYYEALESVHDNLELENAFGIYVSAVYELGDYNKVKRIVQNKREVLTDMKAPLAYLSILIEENKLEEFDKELHYFLNQPLTHSGLYPYPHLINPLIDKMKLFDREDWLEKYLPLYYNVLKEKENFWASGLLWAKYHYYRKDYENMYESALTFWTEDGINAFTEYVGVALFKMGKLDELKAYMEEIQQREETFPGATSYALAVITSLYDKEASIPLFETSIKEGYEFDFYCYRKEGFLQHMLDYEPFLSITEPKILPLKESPSLSTSTQQ